MEKRVPNGKTVIDKETKEELKIIDAIETNNQFGYGVYLYRFEGRTDTGFGLYRKEFIVKGEEEFERKYTPTFVISAFPASGRTYCSSNYQDEFSMLDSHIDEFIWTKDEKGNNTKERNPNFPDNYIEFIKKNIGRFNVIFVSSDKTVRQALEKNKIKTIIIYPNKNLKSEWLKRLKNRDDSQEFINFISKEWDNFIDDIEKEDFTIKERLNNENSYLDLNYLYGIHDNSMGNLCCLWANG